MTARTREKRRRRKALARWRRERFRREFGRMCKGAYGDTVRGLFGIDARANMLGVGAPSRLTPEAMVLAWHGIRRLGRARP